jgi:SET domain-containing protein
MSTKLYILPTENKGRGVFAAVEFSRGDIIELCPVVVISEEDRQTIHKTGLHDYYFVWGKEDKEAAIALGYGSLYNHSSTPNAQFINDLENKMIIIECLKPIKAGEEICLKYIDESIKDKVWFKSND